MFGMEIDNGIETLIAALRSGEPGATVSMTGGTVPDSGYMVGGYVDSLIFDSMYLESDHIPYEMIMHFVSIAFPMVTKESMFVGVWVDKATDKVYVDLSKHFDSLDDALDVARYFEEIAIWDLAKSEEIRIDYAAA